MKTNASTGRTAKRLESPKKRTGRPPTRPERRRVTEPGRISVTCPPAEKPLFERFAEEEGRSLSSFFRFHVIAVMKKLGKWPKGMKFRP
jgi:hypothetical protein